MTRAAGVVVAAHGRRYLVETAAGALVGAVPRGKKSELVCGDRVEIVLTAPVEAVIEVCAPRTSLLRRAAAHREKSIAANIDQVAVVTAVEPSFSDEVVARVLVAAAAESLEAIIVLNKIDLADAHGARDRLAPFHAAGYAVVEIAARRDVAPLAARLAGRRTALVGQSGMGKSTIVNALFPDANAATREISRFLASGRHTTTAGRLYRFAKGGSVIDSPGVQAFGLAHLDRVAVERGFVDIAPYLGRCRFNNCRHLAEPDCAVRAAVVAGAVNPRRLELLTRILAAPGA